MSLPLRLRLALAFAAGMPLVLSGLGAFLYYRLGADLMASVDLGLRSRAQVVANDTGRGDVSVIDSAGTLIDPDESFAQILDPSGHVLHSSSPDSKAPLFTPRELMPISGPAFFVKDVPAIDADAVRLLAVPVNSPGGRLFVVVGATLGDRRDALAGLVVALAIGGPAALALTSAAGWIVAGLGLRPVERMRQQAAAISVSEPDRRLPVPSTGDELARLATTLNSMLARLQQAFERERRFVDDASHELRTPLSILKMELDLALTRARTPEELEAVIRSASGETDRLARLAEDLLVLARADRGHLPLHREGVAIAPLLANICAAYESRGRAAGVHIEVEGGRGGAGGTASVDPVRVRQAVENLLDNSLRQTPPGGTIKVRADRDGGAVILAVEDSGPGFREDLLDRAFEPFTRSDDMDGNGDGAGLGLAIVRAVAEAHGGTAKAENLPGGGARLTFRVPG
jgi:two-component system OmpR family sensor kinase